MRTALHQPVQAALKECVETGLSVIVPCFNEEAALNTTLERIMNVCNSQFGEQYEIILVDDGSNDATWELIENAAQQHRHAVGVRLSRNHGHQSALLAGLAQARGSLILIIDADLQDPPELLPAMCALMDKENADVVYGKRRSRAGESDFKKGTAKAFYRLLSAVTDVDIPIDSGDFRLMRRHIGDLLLSMPERDRFTRGMVAWLGFKQIPIEYDRAARTAGETKYTMRKMLRLAVDAFLGFSLLPLRMAMALSAITFFLSLTVIAYTIWSWLALQTAPGWASVMILVAVVASAQFSVLGIIGEYVGRVYLQGKQRPLYLVRNVIDRRKEGK